MLSPSEQIRKFLNNFKDTKAENQFNLFQKLEEALLLENMTPMQAVEIFKQYGATENDLTPQNLRKTRVQMVNKYHPDRTGGDHTILARLNAAYDVLSKTTERPTETPKDGTKASATGTPAWQTDPRSPSNYRSKDYRDANWIKTRMWELSNRSKEKWTIYGFDGAFFRASIAVFGSDKIFSHMAEAMIMYQTKGGNPYDIKAVLAQKGDESQLYLIWINGELLDPPEIYEFESFNSFPGNDRKLEQTLANACKED